MKQILFIGLGGFLGSILRYGIQLWMSKHFTHPFPLGTFIVNIIGCFVIGLLYAFANKYTWMTTEWQLFLITGICGSYTTFSAFSYESITLFRQGNYMCFTLYVMASVVLGLMATVSGMAIVK